MNSGFQKQDFQGALVALAHPALAHVPATRLENACATGSAALYTAMDFIESGRGRVALVVGAEKMSARPTSEVGDILLNASYRKEEADIEGGFAGVVWPHRLRLFRALWRSGRGVGSHRGEEPP